MLVCFSNLKIILFLFLLKSVSSICRAGKFYIDSFTLNNGNIMIITYENISFYDSSLNLLKYYNYYGYEYYSIYNHISQYSNEFGHYILILSQESLLLFDKEGNNLCDKTFEFLDFKKYIIPIDKIDDSLYFIINYSKIISFSNSLIILYYEINIKLCDINLIVKKNDTEHKFSTFNVECLLMKDINKNNILTCFYLSWGVNNNHYFSANT